MRPRNHLGIYALVFTTLFWSPFADAKGDEDAQSTEREMHVQKIEQALKNMEAYGKLVPGDHKLGGDIESTIQFWRWDFSAARKAGVVISPELEKRRKLLEDSAFERHAEHALKEYTDFIFCRPSRFASKGVLYGWNAYWDALSSQTKLPVMLVWAINTPNAARINTEYSILRSKFTQRFFLNGPMHGMGGMADYGKVCGKELEKHLKEKEQK